MNALHQEALLLYATRRQTNPAYTFAEARQEACRLSRISAARVYVDGATPPRLSDAEIEASNR